ncbi:hypothetical protein HispidOSU_022989 [Sigmodon hispidus]
MSMREKKSRTPSKPSRCKRAVGLQRSRFVFVNDTKVFRLKKARDTQGFREKSHRQLALGPEGGSPGTERFHGIENPPGCSSRIPPPPFPSFQPTLLQLRSPRVSSAPGQGARIYVQHSVVSPVVRNL